MTIKPFERSRNGRGAYLAVMANHAGDDKWDRIIETAEAYVQKKKWDGTSGVTLEYHIDKLKASYIDLEAGATHVPYTVPNARTHVCMQRSCSAGDNSLGQEQLLVLILVCRLLLIIA